MRKIIGNAFVLGDHIDTDQILPGYAMSYPEDQLKEAALKGSAISDFSTKVRQDDLIFAGENFGCGSSREQAPIALKNAGVGAIVAGSFARIFRRNAINIGLAVIQCSEINTVIAEMHEKDQFEVDIENCRLINLGQQKVYSLQRLSESTLETLEFGGLINKVIKVLEERKSNQ